MNNLMLQIAALTTWEVAFGVAIALLLAVFLIPMYILHCTGRNLLSANVGRIAHREWLLPAGIVLVYSRWPVSKGWYGCNARRRTHNSCCLTLGVVQIDLTRLAVSQRSLYKETYKHAKQRC